jgi:hypothetical protein
MPKCQDFKMLKCQNVKILKCQNVKMEKGGKSILNLKIRIENQICFSFFSMCYLIGFKENDSSHLNDL